MALDRKLIVTQEDTYCPVRATLALRGRASVVDLLSGRRLPPAREHELDLDPVVGLFLELEEER